MKSVIYVGMDVHSKTISLCAYKPEKEWYGHQCQIETNSKLVWKYIQKLLADEGEPGDSLVLGYEAGCLGFYLAQELLDMGLDCRIMAPTTIRTAAVDRIRKTDRRDAKSLAYALAYSGYNEVHIPDQQDLDIRDYIRMREDTQQKVKETKQQINAFILKHGQHYSAGRSKWTIAHLKWLKEIELSPLERETLDEYLSMLEELKEKVERFDQRITEFSNQPRYKKLVDALSCFKGITRPIAMRIISEVSDFSRFETAGDFASYLGLTPSSDSSGDKDKKGAITKMGNAHVRKTLVEAAQSAVKGVPGRKSKVLKKRQEGNSSKVIHYADKGNARILSKFKRMMYAGKNRNTAITACAREMACFVWGMATGKIEDRVFQSANQLPFDPLTGEILAA